MKSFLLRHKFLLLALFGALVLRVVIAPVTANPDLFNHIAWGNYAYDKGFIGIYDYKFNLPTAYDINQPPGTLYIFLFIKLLSVGLAALSPALANPAVYSFLLKLPAILADLGIGALIYWFTLRYVSQKRALILASLFLFNPITFYNSAWWGQTDATVNFFGLLAFILLVDRRIIWALAALAACLFIKASLVIFVPVFIVVAVKQHYDLHKLALGICLPLIAIWIVTLPFHHFNEPLWFVYNYVFRVLIGSIAAVNENAFNVWALVFGITPKRPSWTPLLGIPASIWGYSLVAACYIPILYLLNKRMTLERLFLSLTVCGFVAFLFLTGMHERYLFPVFPMFTILLAFRPKLWWLYVLASIIHLTNLYYLWWQPEIGIVKSLLEIPGIIPFYVLVLFTVVVGICYHGYQQDNKVVANLP